MVEQVGILLRDIWDQECANAGTTPLIPFGLTMLGPVIIGLEMKIKRIGS